MRFLFALFIIIPILEMLLLIKVGSSIGVIPTVGLVLLTAVIGISLLKQQGFATLNRLQSRLNQGEIPTTELVEGALLLVGGALLLTPGFVTDAIGFVFLIPFLRTPIANAIITRGVLSTMSTFTGRQSFRQGSFHHSTNVSTEDKTGRQPEPHLHQPQGGKIIDGEFKEED